MISIRWITVNFLLWGITAIKIVMRVIGLIGMPFAEGLTQASQESRLICQHCRSEAEEDGGGHKAGNGFGDLHF